MQWLCAVAAASIRGRRLFRSAPQIVRRLFEGGVYSRAASIRGNTVLLGLLPDLVQVTERGSEGAMYQQWSP